MLSILKAAGENCERLLERRIRNVAVDDVQLDEIWTFVKKKEHRKTAKDNGRDDIGDQFVFIAVERNTKLVITWRLGRRDGLNTQDFITKLGDATAAQRFQLSSDAFQAYRTAIKWGLHDRADYAQIIELFGKLPTGRESYRPAKIKGTIKAEIQGNPNRKRICPSHVERLNNSLRQHCKRFTRLTLALSKKQEHLRAALALHFAFYNFCRVHGSLRVTPAMEAGITDHVWTLGGLISA